MHRTVFALVIAALAVPPALAPALAQGGGGALPAQPQTHMADKAAVTFIVTDAVGDVQLANLALQKSQTPSIRSFAQTMVADHTKSGLQAMDLAKRIGATDAKLQPSDETLIAQQHLARYKGYEFDEEWLKHEITAHQSDIETVRDAMEVAANAAVLQFEQTVLQTDEKHLSLANAAFDDVERTQGRSSK